MSDLTDEELEMATTVSDRLQTMNHRAYVDREALALADRLQRAAIEIRRRRAEETVSRIVQENRPTGSVKRRLRSRDELVKLLGENGADNYQSFPEPDAVDPFRLTEDERHAIALARAILAGVSVEMEWSVRQRLLATALVDIAGRLPEDPEGRLRKIAAAAIELAESDAWSEQDRLLARLQAVVRESK